METRDQCQASPGAARRRAVVCDADEVSCRVLARTLDRLGFQVSVCGTAAECEARVGAEAPDLVVLAVLLPDLDGLALTRLLRTTAETPHIVVVSALQAASRALEAGADLFLLKPVSPRQLVAVSEGLRLRGMVA